MAAPAPSQKLFAHMKRILKLDRLRLRGLRENLESKNC
jgi:hypothetical protein